MATLAVYDANKNQVGTLTVSDTVFAITPQEGLLHEVVTWQLAKRRSGNACVKTRAEVSGGGKKPWRQKGSGRARAGSNTSPLWRRGGAVHGPKPRDYAYSVPKKVRRLALRMALSAKLQAEKLLVLRDFGLEGIRTKDMAALLGRYDIGKAVIVMDSRDDVVERSARNIPHVKVLPQDGLNVYDLLKYEYVIIREPAVQMVEKRLMP